MNSRFSSLVNYVTWITMSNPYTIPTESMNISLSDSHPPTPYFVLTFTRSASLNLVLAKASQSRIFNHVPFYSEMIMIFKQTCLFRLPTKFHFSRRIVTGSIYFISSFCSSLSWVVGCCQKRLVLPVISSLRFC